MALKKWSTPQHHIFSAWPTPQHHTFVPWQKWPTPQHHIFLWLPMIVGASVLKRFLIQSMELRYKSCDTEVSFFRFVDKFHRGQQRILDIHQLVTRSTHFLFGDREKNVSIVELCQRFFNLSGSIIGTVGLMGTAITDNGAHANRVWMEKPCLRIVMGKTFMEPAWQPVGITHVCDIIKLPIRQTAHAVRNQRVELYVTPCVFGVLQPVLLTR